MEILQSEPEQQGIAQRIGDTLRSGYEHAKRNLTTYAAIGASAATLTAGTEIVAPETVGAAGATPQELSRKGPRFKTGHYEGTTEQICSTGAATAGLCEEGQKIPISFTLKRSKAIDVDTVIIDECSDGSEVLSPVTNETSILFQNSFHVVDDSHVPKGFMGQVEVLGGANNNKAQGVARAVFNPANNDPDGVWCDGQARWRATLTK